MELQNKLFKVKEEERKTREMYVDPEELRHRLDDVVQDIKAGEVMTK